MRVRQPAPGHMRQLNSSYRSPARATLRDARVQAFKPPLVAPPPHGFDGGVVLGESKRDLRLRHSRYWEATDRFDVTAEFQEKLDGPYIYFGPLYDHFGHTMAEMVHRLIPSIKIFGKGKFLLVDQIGRTRGAQEPTVPKFLRDIFELLSISLNDFHIIGDNSIVSELHICEQGSDFGGGPKEGYLGYLSNFVHPRLDARFRDEKYGEKLYVSRSKIKSGGVFLGESYLEALLEEEGFRILHPEEHSIIFQMHAYRSATILVFSEGSACHGLELLGEQAVGMCHILERRENHREIFRRVISPRAHEFYQLRGSINLGTRIEKPGGWKPPGSFIFISVRLRRPGRVFSFSRASQVRKFQKICLF